MSGGGRTMAASCLALVLAATCVAPAVAEMLADTAIGGGARGLGLGEGGAAVLTGAESLFWTPSGVARSEGPELLLGHTSWVEDVSHESAAVVLPAAGIGIFGVAATWQTMSGVEERDAEGNLLGKFSFTTGSGNVTYSRLVTEWLAAGVGMGILIQNGVSVDERALPVCFGLELSGHEARLGFSGMDITLPRPTYQLSGSYKLSMEGGMAVLATGGVIMRETEGRVGGGAEIEVGRNLRLRAGYIMPMEESELGSLSNITAGVGFFYTTFGLDYAYLPLGDLGQVHRIQVCFRPRDWPGTPGFDAWSEEQDRSGTGGPSVAPGSEPAGDEVEVEFVVPARPEEEAPPIPE